MIVHLGFLTLGWMAVMGASPDQVPPQAAPLAARTGARLPTPPSAPGPLAPGQHPLVAAIEFARARYENVRENVRDFSCVLVKRERIDGRLLSYEFIRTRVRLQQTQDGRVVTPFSVYMQYLAPAKYRGRKVLFLASDRDGKMLVRNGGARFSYVTLRIAPDSDAAMRESRYPITELGLENVARRLIERAEEDFKCDPDGRSCTRIRVVHPRREANLSFHIANIFVDDELNVPIRVEGYDWPAKPGDDPLLLEEYTYTKLRLNVGLNDADFSPKLLEK
jgi:hypothetical protein